MSDSSSCACVRETRERRKTSLRSLVSHSPHSTNPTSGNSQREPRGRESLDGMRGARSPAMYNYEIARLTHSCCIGQIQTDNKRRYINTICSRSIQHTMQKRINFTYVLDERPTEATSWMKQKTDGQTDDWSDQKIRSNLIERGRERNESPVGWLVLGV